VVFFGQGEEKEEPEKEKLIPKRYYLSDDVVLLSKDLIGKVLVTSFDGERTAGLIVETEAYRAPDDKASHAYGNRKTKRNAVMFEEGGIAYVYLCYGIHHLFNIVTNSKDVPHAILIRALHPIEGIELMAKRRTKKLTDKRLCVGPGSVSQAMGITTAQSGHPLIESPIWLEDPKIEVPDDLIKSGPRIGIDYAGEDAKLPWRFYLDPLAISQLFT